MRKQLAHIPFSPAKCPVFYGWPIAVAGALGVLMSVPGQTMGVSVFTDSLLTALDLTRNQLSTAYMCGTVGSACLMPHAGRLYDRLGSRVVAVLASLCLALVLVVLSRSDALASRVAGLLGLAAPTAGYAVIAMGFFALRFWGQGVLTLASHNMVSKWFDRRRSLATGISGILSALGFAIAPLALDILIRHLGAISGLNMCLIVLFSAVGPVLFSQSLSWTGTYRSASLVCLIATGVLLTASFRVRPPVQVHQGVGIPIAERSQSDLALPRSIR